MSGIGNIYADEALWAARLHYAWPTEALTRARAAAVLTAAAEVMRNALGHGGTSFDSLYVNVNGSSGYFDRALAVYGREGEPCPRCGTPIRREPFMNRSSFRCPRCQRAPHVSAKGGTALLGPPAARAMTHGSTRRPRGAYRLGGWVRSRRQWTG